MLKIDDKNVHDFLQNTDKYQYVESVKVVLRKEQERLNEVYEKLNELDNLSSLDLREMDLRKIPKSITNLKVLKRLITYNFAPKTNFGAVGFM